MCEFINALQNTSNKCEQSPYVEDKAQYHLRVGEHLQMSVNYSRALPTDLSIGTQVTTNPT